MSDLGLLIPIAAITIGPASWAFTTWVRAKHGYPLENRRGRRNRQDQPSFSYPNEGLESQRKIELLSSENDRLTGQIGRLEERLRVLERIATDPGERTAREIEALRDQD